MDHTTILIFHQVMCSTTPPPPSLPPQIMQVVFVDYGNVEWVPFDFICELPMEEPFRNMRMQVKSCDSHVMVHVIVTLFSRHLSVSCRG